MAEHLHNRQVGSSSLPGSYQRKQKGASILAENKEKTTKRSGNNGNGFKPGQSGNPGGRPKKTPEQKDALEAIRDLAPNAPVVLLDIMNNPTAPPAARLKAVEMILDRTYGKPDMAVKLEDPKNDVLAEIRATVKKIKGGGCGD